MATLYLVSTPIGNLEDITLRAVRILNSTSIIACEDTRKTSLLLQNLREKFPFLPRGQNEVRPTFISFFEGNEERRIPQIVNYLLNGLDVALATSAGTPLISDPGFKLVRTCYQEGIKVVPIPGASAVLAALVASGLPTDKFIFLGYLPKKPGKRQKLIQNLANTLNIWPATSVIYITPHRLLKELAAIKEIFGDIKIVLCAELTKFYESIRREKISQTIGHFEKQKPKGEYTLLFHPKKED